MLTQEFKDTQPTNEPNTSVDYRDPTDVDEVQDERSEEHTSELQSLA